MYFVNKGGVKNSVRNSDKVRCINMYRNKPNHFWKRIHIILINCLVLTIGIFSINSVARGWRYASYDVKIGNFTYDIYFNNETATVTGCDPGFWDKLFSSVTIPKTVKYEGKTYPVKKVGKNFCPDGIKKIYGDSIEIIEEKAFFWNNGSLTTVSFPDATSIEEDAFVFCKSLKNVTISKAKNIGRDAFLGCESLENISLPQANYIGYRAFGDCLNLKTVELPQATYLGNDVFINCKELKSLKLNNATYIGADAFQNCDSLTSVEAENLVYCDSRIFRYIPNPSNFTFKVPESMKEFGLEKLENGDKIKIVYTDNRPIKATVTSENLNSKCQEIAKELSDKLGKSVYYDSWPDSSLIYYPVGNERNSQYHAAKFYYWEGNREITAKYCLLMVPNVDVKIPNNMFFYDKEVHKPKVIIKDGSYTLQEGLDYNLKYDDNLIDIGQKSVTIEFIGDYSGLENRVCTFEIYNDTSDWGEIVVNDEIVNYVDEHGKTSAEVTGNEIIWLKESSDGSSAWYAIDNSKGTFRTGSRFWVKWLSPEIDREEFYKYYNQLDEEVKNKVKNNNMWIFLTGVTDPDGNEYTNFDGTIDYYIQIGEDWDVEDINAVFISAGKDEVLSVSYVNFPGINSQFAKISLSHFSPYAVFNTSSEQKSYNSNVRSGLTLKIQPLILLLLMSSLSTTILRKPKYQSA